MTSQVIEVGELMARRNGSVDPSKFPDEEFELHSIPAFDVGRPEILQGTEIGSSKQVVEPDDVMISKIVPHIRRSSVVGPASGRRQIASSEWIVFRSGRVFPHYLRHLLVSDQFNAQFMSTVSGVGGSLLRARPAEVAKIKISLPPITEQRRIAAILDKADALRASRSEVLAKLDQLLQSVFLDMFGDPIANPRGWRLEKVGSVLEKLTDGTHHSPPSVETGIPYVTAKHVKVGRIVFKASPTYVSPEDHRAIYSRCDPKKGDVLYIKDGATTGIAAVNRFDHEFSMLSSVALLRPELGTINSEYLESWLNFPSVKESIIANMGGAAIKRLTLAKIGALVIPVPPSQQQDAFATIKEKVLRLRRRCEKSFCSASDLFDSVKQRAFLGAL